MQEAIRDGTPIPDRIRNAPELEPGLQLYYLAFWDLTTCRPLGMSEGPISWLAIDEYCNRCEITGEMREDLHHHIRSMDAAYLEYREKKRPKPTKTRTPPKTKGGR